MAGLDVKYKQEPDPLHDKSPGTKKAAPLHGPQDFNFDRDAHTCVCPAGQSLYGSGRECRIGGQIAIKFRGSEGACGPCTLRDHCLRTPDKTKTRQDRQDNFIADRGRSNADRKAPFRTASLRSQNDFVYRFNV